MIDHSAHRRSLSRIRWMWVGYWCFLFVIMHVPPMKPGPFQVDHMDKMIHFALYFVLVRLGGHYDLSRGRRTGGGLLMLWALIYALYAGVDEWLQPLVGRTMSLGDWLADAAGIAAATFWVMLRQRAATPSEPSSPRESA